MSTQQSKKGKKSANASMDQGLGSPTGMELTGMEKGKQPQRVKKAVPIPQPSQLPPASRPTTTTTPATVKKRRGGPSLMDVEATPAGASVVVPSSILGAQTPEEGRRKRSSPKKWLSTIAGGVKSLGTFDKTSTPTQPRPGAQDAKTSSRKKKRRPFASPPLATQSKSRPMPTPSAFRTPHSVRTDNQSSTGATPGSTGGMNPIQMGTPKSLSRFFHSEDEHPSPVISVGGSATSSLPPASPGGRSTSTGDGNDSASDSDSVKELFSDQVNTLDTLLKTPIGPLGLTTEVYNASTEDDSIHDEERGLEASRRKLQQELSMIDYSVLDAAQSATPDAIYSPTPYPQVPPTTTDTTITTPGINPFDMMLADVTPGSFPITPSTEDTLPSPSSRKPSDIPMVTFPTNVFASSPMRMSSTTTASPHNASSLTSPSSQFFDIQTTSPATAVPGEVERMEFDPDILEKTSPDTNSLESLYARRSSFSSSGGASRTDSIGGITPQYVRRGWLPSTPDSDSRSGGIIGARAIDEAEKQSKSGSSLSDEAHQSSTGGGTSSLKAKLMMQALEKQLATPETPDERPALRRRPPVTPKVGLGTPPTPDMAPTSSTTESSSKTSAKGNRHTSKQTSSSSSGTPPPARLSLAARLFSSGTTPTRTPKRPPEELTAPTPQKEEPKEEEQGIAAIESSPESENPVVYDDTIEEDDVVVSFQPSSSREEVGPAKRLDFSKADVRQLGEPMTMKTSDSDDDSKEKKGGEGINQRCVGCFLLIVLLAIPILILLAIGDFDGDVASPNELEASLPPAMMPSSAPNALFPGEPSLDQPVAPTIAQLTGMPTLPPAEPNEISFSTQYGIVIAEGSVVEVPFNTFALDLIASMDRLTDEVLANLQDLRARNGDPRIATLVILPTTILRFESRPCPKPNPRDVCQTVVAELRLTDAEETWDSFKITLEIAVAIGRLQYHLDRIAPDSPVTILDTSGQPTPPLLPPSESPPTTPPVIGGDEASLMPTKSPSFPTSSPAPTSTRVLDLLVESSFDSGAALKDPTSPQHEAFNWLIEDAEQLEYSDARLIQRYAIATLFYSTGGRDWLNNDLWLSATDECSWLESGTTTIQPKRFNFCSHRGELKQLTLDSSNLSGALPPELGLLSNSLETLTITGGPTSFLSSTIPSEFGYLTKLKEFSVRGNSISGTIPVSIAKWTKLEYLDLSDNNLMGSIPSQIGGLVDLLELDFSFNKLTGILPTEIGSMHKMNRFLIESNILAGPIPTQVGSMRRLKEFLAGNNRLTSIPSELQVLQLCERFSLQHNQVGGTIPVSLRDMRRLQSLELGHNELTGPIPPELGDLRLLRGLLDLSHNNLSGSIPSELARLNRLKELKLEHNQLSGTLATEIADLVRLENFRLDSNDLSGAMPPGLCTIFNVSMPTFIADCVEFDDDCPCCAVCCDDATGCECRYTDTPLEFLCFQK